LQLVVVAILLAAIAIVYVLKTRPPGGRPFGNGESPLYPIDKIDDPNTVLATLKSQFNSSSQPMTSPIALYLARACDAAYGSGETTVPRLFFDLRFDQVVPIEVGSAFATVGIKDDIAVVVFRGTDQIDDWYANLHLQWHQLPPGRVH